MSAQLVDVTSAPAKKEADELADIKLTTLQPTDAAAPVMLSLEGSQETAKFRGDEPISTEMATLSISVKLSGGPAVLFPDTR
jgi:hypothetical protein